MSTYQQAFHNLFDVLSQINPDFQCAIQLDRATHDYLVQQMQLSQRSGYERDKTLLPFMSLAYVHGRSTVLITLLEE